MKIPNFIDVPVVEVDGEKKGQFTETWRNIFTQLFQVLQQNASDESLVTPQQTTLNISQLQGANMQKYTGGLIYDSTTNKLKVSIFDPMSGTNTFKEIQLL
jgi:hypothetical protein